MSRVLVMYREAGELGPYLEMLVAAGLEPVLARADAPAGRLDQVAGLLLTGGSDVDPALYGEDRAPETDEPDRERDSLERALLLDALDRDLPVLAICRGLQLLNVVHGGDLIQHLDRVDRHRRRDQDRAAPVHHIEIEADTLLHSVAGTCHWDVNSRHHQAVKIVGKHLQVSAIDPEDGTIEALERADKTFVLGVQWHPENQAATDPNQLRIFQSFGEAVRQTAARGQSEEIQEK